MQRIFKVAKRSMGGVGNVINTLTTAAVDMVQILDSCTNCSTIFDSNQLYTPMTITEHSDKAFSICL